MTLMEERVAALEEQVTEALERLASEDEHVSEARDMFLVRFQPKEDAGAPTHEASAGTPVWVIPDIQAYINSDGATGWTLLDTGGAGADKGALYLVLAANADLTAERLFTASTGLTGVDGGPNSTFTLKTADGEIVHDALSGGGVDSAHHTRYTAAEARTDAGGVASVTFGWDPQSPQVFAP